MKHIYNITGMTCNGCKASVQEGLSNINGVTQVNIDLESAEATIFMDKQLPIEILQKAIPDKYSISEKMDSYDVSNLNSEIGTSESKFQQLKPLLLILFYIASASILLNYTNWNFEAIMLDFMGLFLIVFSFFKMLDLKGFPESFKMYDPLAKAVPIYGKVYPFIETALGLMFLIRIQLDIALLMTLIILCITTYGVARSLLDKKTIRCACLGTVLKLPMTEATLIENAIMIVMGIAMLSKRFIL